VRTGDYHGIVVNRSQRERAIFDGLDVIGERKVLLGLIVLYKIRVAPKAIDRVIKRIQGNMSTRFLFRKQEYYAHFYRADELIIVFRDKTFTVSTDKKTWKKAIAHGVSLGIVEKQLDFVPNRVADERF
jgi:hypothetical protein